jgi:Flp pilus assembly protein TadG
MRSSLGGMTILLIIVALLVMASGFGLIYYSAVFRPSQLHALATTTVQTAQAQSRATANTQATGTAQANANASATAQTIATRQAIATTTVLQNIYNQATGGSPFLNESLNTNTISNWDVGGGSLGGSCGFSAGAYHVIEPNKNYYLTCVAENSNFSNFAFQAQMTIIQGDEGGLIFRASGAKLYSFGINRQGLFSFIVSKNNNPGKPLVFGPNTAINTSLNHPNLLTVIARNSTIYLYINKQYVDTIKDTTYSAGQIGVYAADSTHYTDVAFNNAQLWQLGD